MICRMQRRPREGHARTQTSNQTTQLKAQTEPPSLSHFFGTRLLSSLKALSHASRSISGSIVASFITVCR